MQLPDFLTRDADGFIHVTDRRVGLDQLVYYYNEGYSPEMLADEFPAVSLAIVHKVLGFYLENQEDVNTYIALCRSESTRQRADSSEGPSIGELRGRKARRVATQGI